MRGLKEKSRVLVLPALGRQWGLKDVADRKLPLAV